MRVKTPLLVTPGSERVRATIERDGLLADLEAIGATVLANACGPCIGQWQRDDVTADRGQRHRHLVQPQLPQAQRRQRQHAVLRHVTGDGDGLRARPARSTATRSPTSGSTSPGRRGTAVATGSRAAKPASSRRRPTAPASRSWSTPTATGSSCSSRSRPGTATTSPSCRSCSRPRASAPPTTSRPPGSGSSTAATSRTSAATSSSA